MSTIKSKLIMKSTAQLNEQVLEDLKVPDPTIEEAEAILKGEQDDDEETRGTGNQPTS
jgi:hypothetical protein